MIQDQRQPDERPGQIAERIERQVKEMSLADVWWDIQQLTSNAALHNQICEMIFKSIRELKVPDATHGLLEDLFSKSGNELLFIEWLELEGKIRQMLSERMTEREVEELE